MQPASRLSIVCGSLLMRRAAGKVPAFDVSRIMIMLTTIQLVMCMTFMLMTLENLGGMI